MMNSDDGSPKVLGVKLMNQPIACWQVRAQAEAQPGAVPWGPVCAHCRVARKELIEMWPVVVTYVIPEGTIERFAYCCSPAHASLFLLETFWDWRTCRPDWG